MIFTEPQWNVGLTIPGLLYQLIHICELKEDYFNPIIVILELLFLILCSMFWNATFLEFFYFGANLWAALP